jgi:hypothetical protein
VVLADTALVMRLEGGRTRGLAVGGGSMLGGTGRGDAGRGGGSRPGEVGRCAGGPDGGSAEGMLAGGGTWTGGCTFDTGPECLVTMAPMPATSPAVATEIATTVHLLL